MKIFKLTVTLILAALTFAACDDTTDTIGSSITNKMDNLDITTSSFNVVTNSLAADSVLSRNNTGIIGKVLDPETGSYLTADYMTQVTPLSSFDIDTLEYIKNANGGEILADSCMLLVSYQSTYGDTLAPMKVRAYEMRQAIPETKEYYSNYDAFKNGYVSKSNYQSSATYSLAGSIDAFKIYLNKEYTDKDGNKYNNYGTYIMQTYAKHPEYFKSNYEFMKHVCPGFYIQHEGGVGNVAEIWNTELQFYWTRKKNVKTSDGLRDSIATSYGSNRFDGTEEALQINKISYNANSIKKLVDDESCTYLKSPAGIFTEVTLPIEEIMNGHEKDSLNTAIVSFPRINNVEEENKYNFSTPQNILMIPKDSLYSYFEKGGNTVDYKTSYYTTYSSSSSTSKNAYTFSNISNMITNMYKAKNTSKNWNKVVLIPVTLVTATENQQTVIQKINHNMGLSSTRLVKGIDTYSIDSNGNKIPTGPIQIKVIYSKFHN